MKKEFEILRDRPKLNIRLTRDSVSAGDDIDALHEKIIETYSFIDPVALASHTSSGYLPSVNGTGHSWECLLNDQLIATLYTNGIKAKISEVTYAEDNCIHFRYNSANH